MQTTFNNAALYENKENLQAVTAWVIAIVIVLAGFRFFREALSGILMRLYEVFIQKNAAGL